MVYNRIELLKFAFHFRKSIFNNPSVLNRFIDIQIMFDEK